VYKGLTVPPLLQKAPVRSQVETKPATLGKLVGMGDKLIIHKVNASHNAYRKWDKSREESGRRWKKMEKDGKRWKKIKV
jgi:hypothetical protein